MVQNNPYIVLKVLFLGPNYFYGTKLKVQVATLTYYAFVVYTTHCQGRCRETRLLHNSITNQSTDLVMNINRVEQTCENMRITNVNIFNLARVTMKNSSACLFFICRDHEKTFIIFDPFIEIPKYIVLFIEIMAVIILRKVCRGGRGSSN